MIVHFNLEVLSGLSGGRNSGLGGGSIGGYMIPSIFKYGGGRGIPGSGWIGRGSGGLSGGINGGLSGGGYSGLGGRSGYNHLMIASIFIVSLFLNSVFDVTTTSGELK